MAYTRFPVGNDAAPHPAVPDAEPVLAAKSRGAARQVGPVAKAVSGKLHWIVILYLLAVFNPLTFNIGSLALSPSRVMIVLAGIPVLIMFFTGKAGRILKQDIFMFLFAGWTMIALFAYGGFAMIELIGISALEILVPYLMARCLIRNEMQYDALLKFMLLIISVMTVAAIIEATTTRQIINQLFEPFGRTYPPPPSSYEKRLGMTRAQTVFQHPILFGTAMSIFFAPMWLSTLKNGRVAGWRRGGIALAATFFSLSTGAWLGLITQCILMIWNAVLKTVMARWKILIALTIIAYITVDLISNRTPFDVFISYATLNSGTGYWRKLIFIYGMENVWEHPVFGLGLGDWKRPSWMFSSSVDNFWLGMAMRYGIPAFLFIAAAYLAIILQLSNTKLSSESVKRHRNALVYAMIGAALSFCTVYIWGTSMYLLWFFLGIGSWIVEAETKTDAPPPEPDPATLRRTRKGGSAVRGQQEATRAAPPASKLAKASHRRRSS